MQYKRITPFILTALLLASSMSCKKTEQKPVQHNIPIKVAIIYDLGGAQMVAREDFHLLKEDAVQIWKNEGVVKDKEDVWFNFQIDRIETTDTRPSKFDKAIKPHFVMTVTTDFEGNATFENVPEGSYYIYGVTQTRGGYAVWSFKVSTNENKTVILDNKNAIFSK